MQLTCDCPVTRNISVTFTEVSPAPINGYTITWKESGSTSIANSKVVTSSPATLENVPVCKNIEINVSIDCGSNQTTTVSHLTYKTCSDTITGSHLGTGYYMYPSYLLELTNSIGTITLNYNTLNKPNKFTVYKGSTIIATSGSSLTNGWVGTAAYAGPWGSSLTSSSTGSFTFEKTDSNCFYSLVVEAFTDVSFTDNFSIGISCPTTVVPQLGITQTSCSAGNGVFRITGSPGTVLSLSIESTEYLTNTSSTSCAGISLAYTTSVGTSASGISNAITAQGIGVAGANNSIYSTMTIPSIGYIDVFTTSIVYNSGIDGSNATITIFEVNGVPEGIVQAICEVPTTGTFNCNNVTEYVTYQATKYSCGSCAVVGSVNGEYVSFPVGVEPVAGRYYIPDVNAAEYGTYVYLLGATGIVTGFAGLIMQNVSSTTCAGACSLSNPV